MKNTVTFLIFFKLIVIVSHLNCKFLEVQPLETSPDNEIVQEISFYQEVVGTAYFTLTY